MSDENKPDERRTLPRSLRNAPVPIVDHTVDAHHLEDGRRVLASREVQRLFTPSEDDNSGRVLGRIVNAVKDLVSPPVLRFVDPSGRTILTGIEARDFVWLCEALKEAAILGTLHANHRHYAVAAVKLTRAWAVIGIEQLIDDATGWREQTRRRGEVLERYSELLLESPTDYAVMFPPRFYEAADRMNRRGSGAGRPSLPPSFYRDYVYDVLFGPDVSAEMKRRNPHPHWGSAHHSHLAPDSKILLVGYLNTIITLMNQSTSFDEFKMRFNAEFRGAPLQLAFG